jgi:hypothetical protein
MVILPAFISLYVYLKAFATLKGLHFFFGALMGLSRVTSVNGNFA